MSGGVRRCQEMSVARCQEVSGDVRRCKEVSGGVRRCQQMSVDVSRCQEMSGDVWCTTGLGVWCLHGPGAHCQWRPLVTMRCQLSPPLSLSPSRTQFKFSLRDGDNTPTPQIISTLYQIVQTTDSGVSSPILQIKISIF